MHLSPAACRLPCLFMWHDLSAGLEAHCKGECFVERLSPVACRLSPAGSVLACLHSRPAWRRRGGAQTCTYTLCRPLPGGSRSPTAPLGCIPRLLHELRACQAAAAPAVSRHQPSQQAESPAARQSRSPCTPHGVPCEADVSTVHSRPKSEHSKPSTLAQIFWRWTLHSPTRWPQASR